MSGKVRLSACPHCGGTHLGLSTTSYNPNTDCENEAVIWCKSCCAMVRRREPMTMEEVVQEAADVWNSRWVGSVPCDFNLRDVQLMVDLLEDEVAAAVSTSYADDGKRTEDVTPILSERVRRWDNKLIELHDVLAELCQEVNVVAPVMEHDMPDSQYVIDEIQTAREERIREMRQAVMVVR